VVSLVFKIGEAFLTEPRQEIGSDAELAITRRLYL
jgi:hypothetical protein